MRIIKYLFLLLLLSLVALSIFVATKKGNFNLERSQVINSPRHSVYNYVNDLKNWENWNSLAVEDSLINISYSQKTIGNGSVFSWDGNQGDGDLLTLKTIADSIIVQKMNFDGNSANLIMSFKDTLGGTKVTWKATGEMGFYYKVKTAFNGGAQKLFGILFEKSLINLDKKLDFEINTFSIKVNGISNQLETNYLAQSFTSEFSKLMRNSEIVIKKITKFCNNNNIIINGKPFIIYHTYDEINKLTKVSICIPIKGPILISEGSDISSKTLKSYQAVNAKFTGDYSHINEGLYKAKEYIRVNHLNTDPQFSHIEVLTIGKKEIKNPSKWVTEIYFPITAKVIVKPTIAEPLDTLNTTSTTTTTLNTVSKIKITPSIKVVPIIKTAVPSNVKTLPVTVKVKVIPSVKTSTSEKVAPTVTKTPAIKNITPIKKESVINNVKEDPSEF
jgi:effector-binding domain-containing protein